MTCGNGTVCMTSVTPSTIDQIYHVRIGATNNFGESSSLKDNGLLKTFWDCIETVQNGGVCQPVKVSYFEAEKLEKYKDFLFTFY